MKDDIFIPLIAVIFVMGFVTFIALELAALGVEAPYLLFLPAVIFCYVFGSLVTAAAALLVGTLSTWYFFIPPVWSFAPPSLEYNITLLLFICVAIVMCVIIYDLNRQIEKLTRENERLSAKNKQTRAKVE
jgi:K+-sensing histidine kinase KdpD